MNYLICVTLEIFVWTSKSLPEIYTNLFLRFINIQLGKMKLAVEFKQLSVNVNCTNHLHGSLILGTEKKL